MTDPIDNIIPRNLDKGLLDTLSQFSQFINELVNYGSHIIKWDLMTPGKKEDHLPPTLFLRNFLEEIDAISVLVKSSSIDPCKNLLRTALENLFCILYLLEADTFKRSMSYLISNALRNRELAEKYDGKSQKHQDFAKLCNLDKLVKGGPVPVLKDISKFLKNTNKLINSQTYLPFKLEFERTKKRLKKTPEWYSLFDGPKNLRELANRLEFPAIYEILYRGWSPSSHGNDILQGKLSSSAMGSVEIVQIRYAKDAQSVTNHCHNLCVILFNVYIRNRIPLKLKEYQQWYLSIKPLSMQLVEKEILTIK